MSKNNKVTLETGRGRKRGHGEGKRGPPKDDKSYKIDINQYIVGGEGMEGVTAGEVVMDSQPTEDGATLGSQLSIQRLYTTCSIRNLIFFHTKLCKKA